ncbi:unnamed protein product, partial [Closterium sp. NIES-53]
MSSNAYDPTSSQVQKREMKQLIRRTQIFPATHRVDCRYWHAGPCAVSTKSMDKTSPKHSPTPAPPGALAQAAPPAPAEPLEASAPSVAPAPVTPAAPAPAVPPAPAPPVAQAPVAPPGPAAPVPPVRAPPGPVTPEPPAAPAAIEPPAPVAPPAPAARLQRRANHSRSCCGE